MSDLASEFRFLPPEYQNVLRLAEESHGIEITLLQRLKGGRSGALLYLVSIYFRDSDRVEHFVLKLDRPVRWGDVEQSEAEKQRMALSLAPPDFARDHMARLAFDPVESEGAVAIFYTIAGDSRQQCRPIASCVWENQLETIFHTVSKGLLEEWNVGLRFEQNVHPQRLLEQWLGYRIRPGEGNIERFFEDACCISPGTAGLIVQGRSLPNPLVYARENDRWGSTRPIDAAVGFLHGDLNTNNVLAYFSLQGEELKSYYLIDFAHFEQEAYLLYDHLYLEISYLIQQVSRVSFAKWTNLITTLAEEDLPEPKQVSADLAGPCAVVVSARRAFARWVQDYHSTLYDDLWGQFRLAAVAAGMNFCNKSRLSREERLAALVYAAAHLQRYCEKFDVPMAVKAKGLALAEEQAPGEPGSNWEPFLEACHGFDSERMYVLVVGPQPGGANSFLSSIGRVGWSLVLDFDQDTQTNGLYEVIEEEIQARRSLHVVTSEDCPSLNPMRATYWYAARGLTGRATTLPADDSWLQWNRKYSRLLEQLLLDLAASSQEIPVTAVILWDDADYARKICELIDQTFGDRAEFVFATPNPQVLSSISNLHEARAFSLRLDQMASGLRSLLSATPSGKKEIILPSVNGQITLEIPNVNWLEEELTLVHLNLGISAEEDREPGRDFLRGHKISWFELGLYADVERDKTKALKEQVEDDLKRRLATRTNLYHYPGAGGTTVALRVAWELHKTYPTVLLNRISNETIGRFRLILNCTSEPILAIVESATVSPDLLETLYSQIRVENVPVVFLVVSRRFKSVTEAARSIYLRPLLNQNEANRFAGVYGQEVPERQNALVALARDESQYRFRVPFYFGLTAFEEDFVQLDSYVGARLEGMTETERRIMCYLGLAYWYAQTALPGQMFGGIISVPSSRSVRLEHALQQQRIDLLVREKGGGGGGWRPSHNLIAGEICQQILTGQAGDRRLWKQNLSTWAMQFIEDCAALRSAPTSKPSDFIIELMRGLFVFRDSRDVLDMARERPEDFAHLIGDIPSKEGQLAVLERLVNCFPEEPHFWAHFGRLLGYQGDHRKAIDAADKAIELDPNDNVLHHMRGMVLRQWAYSLMEIAEGKVRKKITVSDETLWKIDDLSDEAESAFARARELAPQSEHPYVSHIQLLVRSVEFSFKISGKESYSEFLTSPRTMRYQEMVERAENLLEEVKHLEEEREPNRYIAWCENNLTEFYGDYSQVLERWNSLLDRRDIYAPPVRRRLVRIYLARRERSWDNLEARELQRILRLMEENIAEEPDKDWNLRLWFQAARRIPTVSIDLAIERLNYWRSRSDSVDALYYLYILQTLKAIDGSDLAREKVGRLLEECRRKARLLRNRTFSFDWLGRGTEMDRLVHFTRLGNFDQEKDFYENAKSLVRVPGKIARIDRPQAGLVELHCGLKAFFVPERRHPAATRFIKGRDENKDVDFFLGFSYDGLRAWSVQIIS